MSEKQEFKEIKNPPTPRTKLRGWFHMCFVPLVLGSTITLICLAPSIDRRFAVVAYMICSILLFQMSGIYHLFNWSTKVKLILRKIDHCNIFLLIAGTYTPIAFSAIPWNNQDNWFFSGETLCISIWTLTILGLFLHLFWSNCPRIFYVTLYIVLGVFSLIYIPTILEFGGPFSIAMITLLSSGGLLYIIGAIFYAAKLPGGINAKVYGFHELFHTLVIAAYICHTVCIYLAILTSSY